jgi:hypothetical protein
MRTNTKNKNLIPVIEELHRAFDCLNKAFYNNELPPVIITIQSKGKRNALGWFTVGKVWDDGTQEMHEINISAEYANRNFMDIMKTLHHEMIHLYCAVNEIKDCSRSGTYHNTKFKIASEQHGFYYGEDAYDKKLGWTFSKLKPETIEIIKGFGLNEDVFILKRYDFTANGEGEKKKSNIIKWECGCGNIIRTSKDGLRVLCLDCETMFMKSEDFSDDEE